MLIDAGQIISSIYQRGGKPFSVRLNEVQSYGDLSARISVCLEEFDAAGLSVGDRVMIVTRDESAAIGVFLAATLDGKVPTILSPSTPDKQLSHLVTLFEPNWILADDPIPVWANATGVVIPDQTLPKKSGILRRGARQQRQPCGDVSDTDIAYVLFTSGSTSEPKGVAISHGALAAQLGELAMLFDYGPESRIFNGLILSHADGLIHGPILAAAVNGTWLRPPSFTPTGIEEWLNLVSGLGSTHFICVPTIYELIERLALHDDYFDSADLAMLQSVGSKLSANLRARVETRYGKPMANHYGLTETVLSALYNVPGSICTGQGDVGRPIAIETRLLDGNGQAAEEGELSLSGPQIFSGYWRAPELTMTVLKNGWLRTGDYARREKDGSISITGRIKAAINTGGLLLLPDEVDETLMAHKAVSEAVTIGLPHEVFGEIAVSAVVLNGQVDESELVAHCQTTLEPLKIPKRIVMLDAIPRGDIGKPQIGALRNILVPLISSEQSPESNDGRLMDVIEVAARVFRVSPDSLSADSTPDTTPSWDSYTHLTLIMETERHFSCRLGTATIASIRSLKELAMAVAK